MSENARIVNFQVKRFDVTLVVDTSVYASGDVLSDKVAVNLGMLVGSKPIRGRIVQMTVTDRADQGGLLDLVVLDADKSLGTINVAPSISDDDASAVLAVVPVTSYADLGGVQTARPSFDPIYFESDPTGKIYLAAISRDAKTYAAASDVRVRLMVELHNVNQ